MFHQVLRMLIRTLRSKYTELFIGFSMFMTGMYEVYEIFQTTGTSHIGSHHGVAIMGLLTMIRSLAELLHGGEMMEEAKEKVVRQRKKLQQKKASLKPRIAPKLR